MSEEGDVIYRVFVKRVGCGPTHRHMLDFALLAVSIVNVEVPDAQRHPSVKRFSKVVYVEQN